MGAEEEEGFQRRPGEQGQLVWWVSGPPSGERVTDVGGDPAVRGSWGRRDQTPEGQCHYLVTDLGNGEFAIPGESLLTETDTYYICLCSTQCFKILLRLSFLCDITFL